MTLLTDKDANRTLAYRGYMVVDGEVRLITNDDPERLEWRYICPALPTTAETVEALRTAGWPTGEGEIPCLNCGLWLSDLETVCSSCWRAGVMDDRT